MSAAILCSGCLWNRLEIAPATHFAKGVGSYYDGETDRDEVLVPVCDDCAPKWKEPLPFLVGLPLYMEQERDVHHQRKERVQLPGVPPECDHKASSPLSLFHMAPQGDRRAVEQCDRCRSVRARRTHEEPWGEWQKGDPMWLGAGLHQGHQGE